MENRKTHIRKEDIQKILIVKLRGIGDVIMSTILIDNLTENFPSATIDYVTEGPSTKFLENLAEIQQVHKFDRKSLSSRLKLFWNLRAKKYDLVIDAFSNPATAQLTKFSGARWRIGFPYQGRKYAYNLFGASERDKYHMADLHTTLLSESGLTSGRNSLKFGLDADAQLFAKQYFTENGLVHKTVCALIPGGGWSSKRCTPEKFAQIADCVVKRFDSAVLLLWGPGDFEEAKEISNLMERKAILAPNTSLIEMGAMIESSSFTIANDSGPMHISVALGKPTLSIHGPTSPKLQGAYGRHNRTINHSALDCIECNLLECPKNKECFTQLQTEAVIGKVEELLANNGIISEKD